MCYRYVLSDTHNARKKICYIRCSIAREGNSWPGTFSRIIKYDLNGWIGEVGLRSFDYIENNIKSIRGQASQVNKNPDNFQIIMWASAKVKEGQSSRDENRFPFSGSIDEIGSDIQRLKDMGVDHIVFVYNFLPTGRDVLQQCLGNARIVGNCRQVKV